MVHFYFVMFFIDDRHHSVVDPDETLENEQEQHWNLISFLIDLMSCVR